MVRHSAFIVSFLVAASSFACLACSGCASRPPPAAQRAPPPLREPEFASPELRGAACERLRDHVIVVFADDWAKRQGMPATTMTTDERDALYNGFSQAMTEKGTLARFTASCTSSLTPRKFQCGMSSKTRDGLIWCMQASG